jgi:dTDP-4-dehydrorhamnose 3,5-epimerase
MTIENDTEVLYPVTAPYNPAAERILRWDDPKFGIRWPRDPSIISDRDRDAVDYDPSHHHSGY